MILQWCGPLWGPGSRSIFIIGQLPTAQACRLFSRYCLHAARFTLNPGRNLLNNTAMPTIATRQRFIGASDPHAALCRRGRFSCLGGSRAARMAYLL